MKDHMEIEFEPTLSHCIETLAREEYERVKRSLLDAGEPDAGFGERLESLRLFLEFTDFPDLRGKYERYLVQGRRVRFTIQSKRNRADYKFEVI